MYSKEVAGGSASGAGGASERTPVGGGDGSSSHREIMQLASRESAEVKRQLSRLQKDTGACLRP